jgi:hypothetical protein
VNDALAEIEKLKERVAALEARAAPANGAT